MERGPGSSIRVRVPAKINLYLGVGPRRPDGYHDVVSVLQTVGLHDTLELILDGDGHWAHPAARRRMRASLTLAGSEGEGPARGVPEGADNLVLVAARRLMAHLGIDGGPDGERTPQGHGGAVSTDDGPWTRMRLTKRIPVAAGMAGGSADAAAALVGLNRLWGADLDVTTLRDVAALVGSDVPFCIEGGTALATGTGTSVARVLNGTTTYWVVGIDRSPLSTADVYAAFDTLAPPAPTSPDAVLHALRTGDLGELAHSLHNDLEPAAVALRPELAGRRDAMLDVGALGSLVSGSGPTVLGLARDVEDARRIAAAVADVFDVVEVAAAPAGGPEITAQRTS